MLLRYSPILVVAIVASTPASATSYSVTLLQDVGGVGTSYSLGINGSGQIVGSSNTASVNPAVWGFSSDAVLWSSSGAGAALQDVGGQRFSQANAINLSGQSVGFSLSAPGLSEAVVWSATGAGTALPDVGGYGYSVAQGINASGQIVGFSSTGTGFEAVLWSNGFGVSLQDVGGQGVSHAFGINASGQIAGSSNTAGGLEAVLWSSNGAGTALQDVGGKGWSAAYAINASGQSVGFSSLSGGGNLPIEAVLWSSSGAGTVLQDVGGLGDSVAYAINASGESVGLSKTAGGIDAVLWSSTGVGTDLASVLGSGWSSTVAKGINDQGDIVGYGDYMGSETGFLLTQTSTPEPSTWAMMVVGFAGLGYVGRRARRSKVSPATNTARPWRLSTPPDGSR